MKVFISGGCKNGKSTYAERIAASLSKDAKPLYYIATMRPVDDEDRERITRHRLSRKGLGFETIEIATDIKKLTGQYNTNGTYLLDSVTALLANEIFGSGDLINANAHEKVADEILEMLRIFTNLVIVSDYIYSDAAFYDDYTEMYRKRLAYVDRCCASVSDVVIEACYGGLIVHKGKELLSGIFETTDIGGWK